MRRTRTSGFSSRTASLLSYTGLDPHNYRLGGHLGTLLFGQGMLHTAVNGPGQTDGGHDHQRDAENEDPFDLLHDRSSFDPQGFTNPYDRHGFRSTVHAEVSTGVDQPLQKNLVVPKNVACDEIVKVRR